MLLLVVAVDVVAREKIPVVPVVDADVLETARERPVVAGVEVLVALRLVVGKENVGLDVAAEVADIAAGGLLANPIEPVEGAKVVFVEAVGTAVEVVPAGLKLKAGFAEGNMLNPVDGIPLEKVDVVVAAAAGAGAAAGVEAAGVAVPTKLKLDCWVVAAAVCPPKLNPLGTAPPWIEEAEVGGAGKLNPCAFAPAWNPLPDVKPD